MASITEDKSTLPARKPLAMHWRVLISIAVLLHLMAVVAAPMATPNFSGGEVVFPNGLQQGIADLVRPYLEMAYLDHGYRFFAPQPSPGHLVRYKLDMPDGTTSTGVFPDLKTEWPRLFYHRFFMLSEKLNRFWNPEEPGPNDPPEEHRVWVAERETFLDVAHGYAIELLRTTGATKVTIELVRHELPGPYDLEHNRPLADPTLYKTLWTKTYEAEAS